MYELLRTRILCEVQVPANCKLTLSGGLEEVFWGLLLCSQELLQAVHGHLGVHQLRDQLRQLKQGHPQHLQWSQSHALSTHSCSNHLPIL